MSRLGEVAASFARGGFILFIGNTVSLFVSSVGTILVVRMLTPSEYGLYGVSLVLPRLLLLLSDWGVNPALVRNIARQKTGDKFGRVKALIRAGASFKLVVGCILSLTLFISADFLVATMLKRPEVSGLVKLASLLIISQSMNSLAVSVLTGLGKMEIRALVNMIQALIKGICSPLLVYLGFGISD